LPLSGSLAASTVSMAMSLDGTMFSSGFDCHVRNMFSNITRLFTNDFTDNFLIVVVL